MKFVCLNCETYMNFEKVEKPGEGSLGVFFGCPSCNAKFSMVTNPGETQMVSSLGVQLGGRTVALLMASLFESFLYPFVIMFSVPLAALGGILGLALMNRYVFQALDVLTMLGFFILVGTVVNNAILIVHQSLNHIRNEGMEPREAIVEATSNRIRPIFMTVGTSVFGMLPLVLFPGAGSELYRGLGSVVVGGLIVSTIFTLFLVPALLSLTFSIRTAIVSAFQSLFHRPVPSSGGDD